VKGLVFGKTGQVARCLAGRLGALESTAFLDRSAADLARPQDLAGVIEAFEPDVVINAAAYTAVDRAEAEPELARLINAGAPAAMARACAGIGAWFIHYSTDYVFDGSAEAPYTEDMPTAPVNVYGRTKLEGEQAVADAHDRWLVFRTSWVYSNYGRNFLNTMLRLAGERDALSIVDDQIGAPTWAGAIAGATDRVVHALASGADERAAGLYHMTCGGSTSWCGFARRIFELSGRADRMQVDPIPTRDYPTPAARPLYSVLCCDRLEQVFGVRLEHWENALRNCLSERAPGQQ